MKEWMKVLMAYLVVYFSVYCALTIIEKIYMKRYRKAFEGAYRKAYNEKFNGSSAMDLDEACKILGIKKSDLKKMSKADLKRAYWKKAQEVHPDKQTGNEEVFKNVGNAWQWMKDNQYAAA